jgi:hypothetical protein
MDSGHRELCPQDYLDLVCDCALFEPRHRRHLHLHQRHFHLLHRAHGRDRRCWCDHDYRECLSVECLCFHLYFLRSLVICFVCPVGAKTTVITNWHQLSSPRQNCSNLRIIVILVIFILRVSFVCTATLVLAFQKRRLPEYHELVIQNITSS